VFAIVDASGARIAATVSAFHAGYDRTVQYVLVPDKALAAGAYELVVSKASNAGRHTFAVVAASASAPLEWHADPRVVDQRQTERGCGPDQAIDLALGTTSADVALIELTDEKTRRRTSAYVPIADDKLVIGHDMCGGPFSLVRGRSYTAVVSLLAPATGGASAAKSVRFEYKPRTE
jgi:hypothetical protein